MSSKLASLGLPPSIAHASEGFVAVMKAMAADDPMRLGALEAYAHSFRGVFIVMSCVSGTALIASAFIKKFSMDKSLDSEYKLEARNLSNQDVDSRVNSKAHAPNSSESSNSGSWADKSKETWSAV
jgi:hypothetical protein